MKVMRIVKSFGRKIGSTESYSSFEFSPQIIEMQVDIDISTSEGQAEYKQKAALLFQMAMDAHEADVQAAAELLPELKITIEKKRDSNLW